MNRTERGPVRRQIEDIEFRRLQARRSVVAANSNPADQVADINIGFGLMAVAQHVQFTRNFSPAGG